MVLKNSLTWSLCHPFCDLFHHFRSFQDPYPGGAEPGVRLSAASPHLKAQVLSKALLSASVSSPGQLLCFSVCFRFCSPSDLVVLSTLSELQSFFWIFLALSLIFQDFPLTFQSFHSALPPVQTLGLGHSPVTGARVLGSAPVTLALAPRLTMLVFFVLVTVSHLVALYALVPSTSAPASSTPCHLELLSKQGLPSFITWRKTFS